MLTKICLCIFASSIFRGYTCVHMLPRETTETSDPEYHRILLWIRSNSSLHFVTVEGIYFVFWYVYGMFWSWWILLEDISTHQGSNLICITQVVRLLPFFTYPKTKSRKLFKLRNAKKNSMGLNWEIQWYSRFDAFITSLGSICTHVWPRNVAGCKNTQTNFGKHTSIYLESWLLLRIAWRHI